VYFLLLLRRFRRAASSEEVRAYFAIILAAVAVITVNIRSLYGTFGEALRHAAFQVGSIITTTGFSSCDFDLWPTLAKEVLVLLMFVGACAGSTGGGIKVSRFLLLGKTLGKELKQALHPQVVAPVRMDGKLVNHETIRTTNVFLAAYIFIFAASFMLVSLDGFDMVTNFTSVAATLNNIGPGLNQVGPMMNFGAYSNFAKLVLIFDMLAGRLEIFPMLVLFLPDAWRRF
jgi:trk system potassium uptake protein TrkH